MKNISEEEYMELVDSYSGVCLNCEGIRYGNTEPDAEEYFCEECGENTVQGIENALICGNVNIV